MRRLISCWAWVWIGLAAIGCSAGSSSNAQPATFNPDDPAGTYAFELTLPDGEQVAGDLIVENQSGAFRARTDIPNFIPLDLPVVRTEGPDRLILEGQDPMGGRLRADLTFDADEFSGTWEQMGERVPLRGRITTGRTGLVVPNQPIEFETFEELDTVLAERAGNSMFSGSVLVAEGGDVLFRRDYGLAYRGDMGPGNMRPVTPDTRFDIGSLDKLFTSVAVLRLAQDSHIDLDAPIETYMDDLGANISGDITARQLLQFRAGLGDYLGHPELRANPDRFTSVDAFMELVKSQPPAFEPGQDQRYSNSAYVVLGALIESVTGKTYHDAVSELVLVPAGMTSTGPRPDERSAIGYTIEDGEFVSTEGRWPPIGSPAGGGHSTADDLHRFIRALVDDRLLEPAYTDTFLRFFEGPTEESLDRRGAWSAGWTGNAHGLSTAVGYDAPSGRTVVVLMNLGDNRDPPAAGALAESILGQAR